jgi:hypothetical protein
MAHFAEINERNEVSRVIVVNNAQILDSTGSEQELLGVSFCNELFGGTWKQTSYNGNIRKNFAGIGYAFDSGRDAFIAPSPHASWVLNEISCRWEAPVAMPADNNMYAWNEEEVAWEQISV